MIQGFGYYRNQAPAKIHYSRSGNGYTLCPNPSARPITSSDLADVTCKRCRKMAARRNPTGMIEVA